MKFKMYDIVLYNHQGTLKTGTITRIIQITSDPTEAVYELDSQVAIMEDNVLKLLGNMEELKKEVYDE